jgi:hypothetical protein
MNCKDCGGKLKKVHVKVEGTDVASECTECANCGNLSFDQKAGRAVVGDLRKKEFLKEFPALSIRQRVVKLSKDRLGFYFSKDVIRCAKIKAGCSVDVRLLDKKHILLEVN